MPSKPDHSNDTIILDMDKRIVASWASVEVRDTQGQMLAFDVRL